MRLFAIQLHLPIFNVDNSPNLRILYVMRVIRGLVNQLAFLLYPIFLYQIGVQTQLFPHFSLPTQGFLFTCVYLAVYFLVTSIAALPVGSLIGSIGYHRTIIYSYLVRSVTFILLFLSNQTPSFLAIAVVLDAVQSLMFWVSFHTLLSKNAQTKHFGSDLGLQQILLQLVSAITPAISGIVALMFGLHFLFLIGVIGPLIAALASMLMEIKYERDRVSWRELLNWLRENRYKKFVVATAGKTFNDQAIYVWPLYLYIIFGAVDKVGYIQSISLFLALLIAFFMGSYLDRAKTRKPFLATGIITSLVWVVRSGVSSVWHVALTDMADKITSNFHWLYFDVVFFRRGKGPQALSYFTYRELFVGISGLIFWLLASASFYFGLDWVGVFALAVIGGVASLAIERKNPVDIG